MIKLGNNNIGKIYLGSNSIGKAYLGSNLVFQSGGAPLPYTPVAYIQTDGNAYINTGVNGNDPRSCELKCMVGSLPGSGQCILGAGNGDENTSLYYLAYINGSGYLGFGHRYYYATSELAISAQSAFEMKTKMKQNSQQISLKRYGESTYTSDSRTQSSTITTGTTMFLFASHSTSTGNPIQMCSSGTRVYFCKIYSDNSFATLVFDGIPCVYNGEYGLWDKVFNTFFGNAAGTGAFTGPSIS